MKKIMFNDEFRLTQAVLNGRKTMTRRIIEIDECVRFPIIRFRPLENWEKKVVNPNYVFNGHVYAVYNELDLLCHLVKPRYEIGEVVAIAQSYKDSGYSPDSLDRHPKDLSVRGLMKDSAGWNNKMFVKSYACRHHIKIVNVKIERLQDISDEDCLKEGVIHAYTDNNGIKIYHTPHTKRGYLSTDVAQEAFAALIDKVSGKGTWESNPFVFAYEFVLFD
ncbi:hypothetical protein [Bacteroides xylanisolvens]|uniref:hypothetical protein n=1 Tax=Bacteroides xylanisolvens TaxID=371601 RepID=UPI001C3767AF|nr:hypothetical protein [Bacteroides xylanisolvens]